MSKYSDKIIFLESNDFLKDLLIEISKPFQKIKLIFFRVNNKGMFDEIYPFLVRASESGAKVEIEVDGIYSRFNLSHHGKYIPLWGKAKKKQINDEKIVSGYFETLKKNGANISYLNSPNFLNKYFFPFAKRDHRKFIFIESKEKKIFYFGATNLEEKDRNDFMIKVEDPELYEKIYRINSIDFLRQSFSDQELKVDDTAIFLMDYGANFRSIIQQKGYELIKSAQKVIRFVSQLPPEPRLMVEFIFARLKGTEVEVVVPEFNNRQVTGFPYIFVFLLDLILCKFFGISLKACKKGFTHAKVLIVDEKVLLGSHNLSNIGVWAGTREFSALFQDERILSEVNRFVDNLLIEKKENI